VPGGYSLLTRFDATASTVSFSTLLPQEYFSASMDSQGNIFLLSTLAETGSEPQLAISRLSFGVEKLTITPRRRTMSLGQSAQIDYGGLVFPPNTTLILLKDGVEVARTGAGINAFVEHTLPVGLHKLQGQVQSPNLATTLTSNEIWVSVEQEKEECAQ
jgi:hypothetical protein